uniref:DUF433 domain-containing protein n=1 Tax=Candidatus Kentrum sp. SD TaxID=2126332 RepID=A0A450YPA9_9GAMM|nr:MAG: Protein of unknown function (DUF433) [Candidatus Kentron sp. SD]VFK43342.1 MAG: Protein of unknown function (DUF433) [Candidatus Kentron sp. SD]
MNSRADAITECISIAEARYIQRFRVFLRYNSARIICLFSARLYKWIKFSLYFTNAESCIVGLKRSLARSMHSEKITHVDGRISIDPVICNGKPTIRGKRITVQTIIEFLSAGESKQAILAQYPSLEEKDIDSARALL